MKEPHGPGRPAARSVSSFHNSLLLSRIGPDVPTRPVDPCDLSWRQTMHPWLVLVIAAAFEIGWPLGFKIANEFPKWHWPAILFSLASMALSGYFLYLAQKSIPIGTAYAVWTGLGATGTVLIGIAFFHDPASFARLLCVFMIIAGVVGLKMVG